MPALIGHESSLTDVKINADSSRLFSSSNDGTAILWDLESGQQLFSMSEHTGRVNRADFSPSGNTLATASEDTSVKIWDTETGQVLTTLEGHVEGDIGNVIQGVTDVEFSPDGERIATAGADGQAKVWDVETGLELISIQGHPEGYGLTRISFSPDGSLLATGTDDLHDDAMVKVWDAWTGRELYTVDEDRIRIWGVAFSPDGTRLAISDRSGIVNMWALPQIDGDLTNGPAKPEEIFSVPAHSSSALGLLFNSDGTQIVTAGIDGKLSFRDSWTGRAITHNRPSAWIQ